MRLSEAINLGRHLIEKPDPETYCRCAIGMGLAAIGNHFHEGKHNVGVLHHAIAKWPWLETEMAVPVDLLPYHEANKTEAFLVVSILFFAVERQEVRLEQLIDWVRSVEPEEFYPEQKAVELIPVAPGAHTREELAEYFLQGEMRYEGDAAGLAQLIQDIAEDWIKYRKLPEVKTYPNLGPR